MDIEKGAAFPLSAKRDQVMITQIKNHNRTGQQPTRIIVSKWVLRALGFNILASD